VIYSENNGEELFFFKCLTEGKHNGL